MTSNVIIFLKIHYGGIKLSEIDYFGDNELKFDGFEYDEDTEQDIIFPSKSKEDDDCWYR
ncbi:hypothetical protein GCM10011516_09820 [Sphingobacterium cellulitidis]|uniref:Uncharacterized protein n=1 Tax=Sphingobacterium cellulitidis TaxID=1768011 RepID=A0A8H9FX74_9SPHI|nr:hypothetical protein GCM10011516_09820 [Sphingobacterium soli]